jgi:hypothetical protein
MNQQFIRRRSSLNGAEWQCHGRRLIEGRPAPERRTNGKPVLERIETALGHAD